MRITYIHDMPCVEHEDEVVGITSEQHQILSEMNAENRKKFLKNDFAKKVEKKYLEIINKWLNDTTIDWYKDTPFFRELDKCIRRKSNNNIIINRIDRKIFIYVVECIENINNLKLSSGGLYASESFKIKESKINDGRGKSKDIENICEEILISIRVKYPDIADRYDF
jgi:hypothetical protein